MDPFVQLLCVVLAMGVGTLTMGSLPLVLPLGRAKLRYVELFGSGLLLGAAFTVVITEGVGTVLRSADALRRLSIKPSPVPQFATALPAMGTAGNTTTTTTTTETAPTIFQLRGWTRNVGLEAQPDSRLWRFFTDGETVIGTMLLLGFFLMFVLEQVSSRADSTHHHHHGHAHHSSHSYSDDTPTAASHVLPTVQNFSAHSPLLPHHHGHHGHHHSSPSYSSGPDSDDPFSDEVHAGPRLREPTSIKLAGKSLSSQSLATPTHNNNNPRSINPRRHSHSAQSHRHHAHSHHSRDAAECAAAETSVMVGHSHRLSTLVPPHAPGTSLKTALASIVGLLIHALADGIAMGASASSTDEQLRWIVFGAILVHKAPTAFGLCSVLMARGLRKGDTLKALALFSLCTPVGAIVVYLALQALFNLNHFLGSETVVQATDSAATIRQLSIGATLTFSGGTFLFVAMHALEDVTDSPGPDAGVGAEAIRSKQQTQLHSTPLGSPRGGDFEHEQDSGSETSILSGEDAYSLAREKTRLHDQLDSVSQYTRMVLVFLGSLVPKALQMLTGGHGH